MKKRFLILTATLAICLAVLFSLSACGDGKDAATSGASSETLKTEEWVFTADTLEEAEDIFEDFLFLSIYDDNLIVTVSSEDGVFLTETVDGDKDHVEYDSGDEYFVYKDGAEYVSAFNEDGNQYYFIGEDKYEEFCLAFFFYLDVFADLPADGVTVSLTSQGVSTYSEYNIFMDAALSLTLRYDDLTVTVNITKERDKVVCFKSEYESTDGIYSLELRFAYGNASVTLPDITGWFNASGPKTPSEWYAFGRIGGENRENVPMYFNYITGCYNSDYVDIVLGDVFTIGNRNDPSASYSMTVDSDFLVGREMIVFDPREETICFEYDDYFHYLHDPRDNPRAMEDIVEDETAIYGFRPSATGSLSIYADADWSDAELVEQGRQDRIAYHQSLESMYDLLDEMTAEGKSVEEIARAVSAERNRIRLDAYKDDPEGLAALKERNLSQYGHEEGPLPDELYEKYGSWEMVIAKSFSANSGMDACLGLYDDYYDLYVAVGQIQPNE